MCSKIGNNRLPNPHEYLLSVGLVMHIIHVTFISIIIIIMAWLELYVFGKMTLIEHESF
jgi:hypothetical protein